MRHLQRHDAEEDADHHHGELRGDFEHAFELALRDIVFG
mgnify:CR=1 FL=1